MNREETIFAGALRLSPEERPAYIDQASGGDVALRQRVEALLRSHEEAGHFLQDPAAGAVSGIERPGDMIGRYKLLQQIGEGGCGVVYMAEQEEPVRRRVALKVIKLGMDTKSVLARFDAERQALALMDHPNIAKVLDVGSTEGGRPYFVMELVRGVKITEYCDEAKLTTEGRLRLFIKVCQAIQHAHQKGIVHRDIKPSNILVTVNDCVAVPKVIDFGIAKATSGQRLTDQTLFTAFEQFIGTPAYMSPEQAVMTSVDIDTRSDIYTLGVLLYELLTGKTPFDPDELMAIGLDELCRTIREKEPARPSTRVSALSDHERTTTALRRGLDSPRLISQLKGDLDWIVMKTLEKDRARRYETASSLGADIERYLNNEPITASSPSAGYRFEKWVRRNKLAFSAGVSVAAALVIGLGLATWMYWQERQARQWAVAMERDQTNLRRIAENNLAKAETEAAKSRQVAELLEEMLKGVGPSVALGRDTVLLREILDNTAQRVGRTLTNQPEVEAELRSNIGQVYDAIERYDDAEKMHREALAICRRIFGEENGRVASILNDLGHALWAGATFGDWKPRKVAEAEECYRQAVALRRKLGSKGAELADSLYGLAVVLREVGKLAEAESVQNEALSIRRGVYGEQSREIAQSLDELALVLLKKGKAAEAEKLCRQAVAMEKRLFGENDPAVGLSLRNLYSIVRHQGRLSDAEAICREAIATKKKVNSEQSKTLALSLTDLGQVLAQQKRFREAEDAYREAIAVHRKIGSDTRLANYLHRLGLVLNEAGKPADAETVYREALAIYRKIFGENSAAVAESVKDLAAVVEKQGKIGEAEEVFRRSLTLLRKTVKEGARLELTLRRFADFLCKQKRFEEARPLAEEAVGLCLRQSSWPAKERQQALAVLKTTLTGLGDLAGLEKFLRASLALERAVKTNSPGHLEGTITELAGLLRHEKKYTEAEPLCRELLEYSWQRATNNSQLQSRLNDLADVLQKGGNPTNVDLFFKEVQAHPIEEGSNTAELLEGRALFFARWGRWKEAILDTTRLMQLRSTSHVPYHMLAPLLVAAGDSRSYQEHCRKTVARFAATKEPTIADRMAKDCLILPSCETDLKAVCRLATMAVQSGASNRFLLYFQFGKGLAEFRSGNFENAADWEQKMIASERSGYSWDDYLYVEAQAVLAMANYYLNHKDEARAELRKATEMAQAKLPRLENGDLGTIWRDWIIAHALLREAEDTLHERVGTTLEASREARGK